MRTASVCLALAATLAAAAGSRGGEASDRIRADAVFGAARVRIAVTLPHAHLRRSRDVFAVDAFPFGDGSVALRVAHTTVPRGLGPLRVGAFAVRVSPRGAETLMVVTGPRRRFKYVSHAASGGRIVIELWRAVPPNRAAEIPRAHGGCLTITRSEVADGVVRAEGRERAVFEHTFTVRVRGVNGRSLARRTVTARRGRWSAALTYAVDRPQAGTLEAADFSQADASLTCLAQRRIRLR